MQFLARYSKAVPGFLALAIAIVGRLTGVDSDAYYIATIVAAWVGTIFAPKNAPAAATGDDEAGQVSWFTIVVVVVLTLLVVAVFFDWDWRP